MKKKKILTALLILAILIAQTGIISLFSISSVYASNHYTEWNSYFYNQLNPNAKEIYKAILEMFENYQNGTFTNGESIEITDKVTPSSVALFVNGNNELLNDYGAARDAFQYDYPDCFFIDWDELSIRVTQDTLGQLHAFLGAGRSDTYLLKGMNAQRSDKANDGHGTGIQGAIAQYEAKITEVVNSIKSKASSISDKKEKIVKMVGEAHDYVTNNMEYKHEWETTIYPEKDKVRSTSRTAYDGLIFGQGVCEAYTRTFKALCDRLGIPCVCIYGIYSPKSTINEPHIWNYVQIDGKWYGVDVTHDDPTYLGNIFSGAKNENRDFFLVGETQLAAHHFTQGIVSSANYEFKYPQLELDSYRDSYSVETDDGFTILVEKDTQLDNWDGNQAFDSGTFYISYEGMNYTQNEARGKYMVARYYNYNPGTETWEISNWSYIDPWLVLYGDNGRIEELEPSQPKNNNYCVRLELPQTKNAQFAITEVPPRYLDLKAEITRYQQSHPGQGLSADLTDRLTQLIFKETAAYLDEGAAVLSERTTPIIENKWGDYVSPPVPMKCTPRQGGTLYIGPTHHIKLEFNDNLKLKSENAVPGIDVTVNGGAGTAGNWNAGHTALEYSKVSNVKWDGAKTVEFDFKASEMWADNSTFYNFQVTGLIGNNSNRAPVAATYGLRYPCACYAYAAQGYNRNVYAQPQLMETSDIDMSNWQLKDVDNNSVNYGKEETMSQFLDEIAKNNGDQQEFLDSLHDRLTLVTTEPSPLQEEEMKHYLAENEDTKQDYAKAVKETVNTYNISITVCKKMVLRTGESAHIALGFPKGTTYEDFAENGRLSFKAYHYKVDPATDKLTGEVEEIRVTVTRQGLVLWVDSFSPFTVMAVENDKPVAITEKDVLVTSSLGGTVTDVSGNKLEGDSGSILLKEGQSKKVKIVPENGYEIDYIMIDGVRQNITNKLGQTIDIDYDKVETGNVLNVGFVAKEIHAEEKAQNLSSNFEIPSITISLDKNVQEFIAGDKVEITPVVNVTSKDFHPKGDAQADSVHPDYIDYKWYKVKGGRPEPIQLLPNQDKESLIFEKVELSDAGRYHLKVTPMKWNESKQEYQSMQVEGNDFSGYYRDLEIKVYNELNLDLKENDKLEGNKLDGYTMELEVGDTNKLTADVFRMNGENKVVDGSKVTWTSDHPNNVSVDESGLLNVLKYTTEPVKITAKVSDKYEKNADKQEKTVNVVITVKKPEITSVTLDKTELTLEVDGNTKYNEHSGTEILTATVTAENDVNTAVTWTIDSKDIIDIKEQANNTAIITAKKIGKATITATAGNKTATCTVDVVKTPVTGISDDLDSNEIHLVEPTAVGTGTDTSVKITVNVLPDNATNKKVTWVSSDESVATVEVDKNGIATIKPVADDDNIEEVRHCTITATSDDNPEQFIQYDVYVSDTLIKVEDVQIVLPENEDNVLTLGESLELKAHITPPEADIKSVTWNVKEGADVIEVSDTGHVHSKKAGNAVVELVVECQASDCNSRHTKTISIKVNPVYATGVTLDKQEITLKNGSSEKLNATVTPLNVTDSTIKWQSSNKEVAVVDDNGNVTAKGVGEAVITATCGEKSAKCKVTVTAEKVERLYISETSLKLQDKVEEGKQTKLVVTYEPEHASDVKLKWESSDSSVATVDENGIVTPKKAGITTITVSVVGDNTIEPVTCEVTVVPYETEVVIYTVDQNDKFLPGFSLRLMKKDQTGAQQLVNEIEADGKFDFGKLTDGSYTVYITKTTDKDFNNNTVNIIDILEACQFEIIDGQIILINGDIPTSVEAMVLKNIVDYPNVEGEDQLTASFESSKDDTEAKYQEFIKTKPAEPSEQEKPDEDNKNPNTPPSGGNNENPSSGNEQNNNNDIQQEENNNIDDSKLPNTSDIAIDIYALIMSLSLVGIIFIIYKKNKE